MLRISKLSDYATLIMTCFATNAQASYTAKDLTLKTRVTLPTVTKVLKLLTRGDLLVSQRGTKGGYRLAKQPQQISLANVIETVEGKFGLTECSEQSGQCALDGCCTVQSNLQVINQALYTTLNNISITSLAQPMQIDDVPQEAFIEFFKPLKTP